MDKAMSKYKDGGHATVPDTSLDPRDPAEDQWTPLQAGEGGGGVGHSLCVFVERSSSTKATAIGGRPSPTRWSSTDTCVQDDAAAPSFSHLPRRDKGKRLCGAEKRRRRAARELAERMGEPAQRGGTEGDASGAHQGCWGSEGSATHFCDRTGSETDNTLLKFRRRTTSR